MRNFLLLGIGNPGSLYETTRHNIGTIVLRKLLGLYGIESYNKQIIKLESTQCHILFNIAYVNITANILGPYMNKHKITHDNLIVFYDDLELPVGKWQYKYSFGTHGHKGLKSIKNLLQSRNFHKIAIGIGRPNHQEQVADYVLAPIDSNNLKLLDILVEEIYNSKILTDIFSADNL